VGTADLFNLVLVHHQPDFGQIMDLTTFHQTASYCLQGLATLLAGLWTMLAYLIWFCSHAQASGLHAHFALRFCAHWAFSNCGSCVALHRLRAVYDYCGCLFSAAFPTLLSGLTPLPVACVTPHFRLPVG
jgi:hypothetical protein